MRMHVYRLYFTGPVHFSDVMNDYGQSMPIYHSDSLYSALTASLASVGETIPEGGELGFTLSSLFPFIHIHQQSETLYFFPKPLLNYRVPKEKVAIHKKFKKTKWLDKTLFEKTLEGMNVIEDFNLTNNNIADKIFLLSKQESLRENSIIINKSVRARVQIPRGLSETVRRENPQPFYMEVMEFAGTSQKQLSQESSTFSAGLYFLAHFNNESEKKLLEKALTILSYNGLGTDRNVGFGQFRYEQELMSLQVPESDHYLCLGTYIPEKSEYTTPDFAQRLYAFRLLRRGGWISDPTATGYRKNEIFAFDFGSIIKENSGTALLIKGRIVDLTPQADFIRQQLGHPIYRCGRTLFLPIKTNNYVY